MCEEKILCVSKIQIWTGSLIIIVVVSSVTMVDLLSSIHFCNLHSITLISVKILIMERFTPIRPNKHRLQ